MMKVGSMPWEDILWNDETIGVKWPITEDMEVLLSEKDTKWGKFDEIFKFEK